MSLPVKPVTASLKTTEKLIGDVFVGSACPAAWLIVTVGAVGFHVTVLSVLVEAVLVFPAVSLAAAVGIDATTVPAVVIPVTLTVYVGPLPLMLAASVPPAVDPVKAMSLAVKPVTGSLKTTVKLIGEVAVGSDWPPAWLI